MENKQALKETAERIRNIHFTDTGNIWEHMTQDEATQSKNNAQHRKRWEHTTQDEATQSKIMHKTENFGNTRHRTKPHKAKTMHNTENNTTKINKTKHSKEKERGTHQEQNILHSL